MSERLPNQDQVISTIDAFSEAFKDLFPGVPSERTERLGKTFAAMLATMWQVQLENILPFASQVQVLSAQQDTLREQVADMRTVIGDLRMSRDDTESHLTRLDTDEARITTLEQRLNQLEQRVDALAARTGPRSFEGDRGE